MRYGIVVALSLFLLLPIGASAQQLGGTNVTDPFTVSVSPQYLSPYGTATLSFLSSSFDLANATLTVSVNGKKTYSGDVQPVSVHLGASGEVLSVVMKIVSGGIPYTQTVKLTPEDVSLVAEPVSSAPPLYKGKSLVPLDGNTRVVAIADFRNTAGKLLDPQTLSYSWTVDDTHIANSSGIGRDAITVASPLQYRSRTVSVVVTDPTGALVGGADLSLTPTQSIARLYENDPLLGIRFDHALSGSYTINGTESSVYAAAFSLPLQNTAPRFQWFLNSSAAQSGNTITLRPTGQGQGNASLSLTASTGVGDESVASLSLIFGGTTSTNIFGL